MTDKDKALLVAALLDGRLKPGGKHGRCKSKWAVQALTVGGWGGIGKAWWYTETDQTAVETLRTGFLITRRKYGYRAGGRC
jgi:hypothetical protein